MDIILAPNTMEEAEKFKGKLTICKMGLPLIADSSSAVIYLLQEMGYDVLYDGKFHDIPSVVEKAVRWLAEKVGFEKPLWGLTVHAAGGGDMLRVVKEAAEDIKVFGVLNLTSLPRWAVTEAEWYRRLSLCKDLDGVICAVSDVWKVKDAGLGLLTLCPGIREWGGAMDDQLRISTIEYALEAGPDAVIIGRPLCESDDPDAALATLKEALHE